MKRNIIYIWLLLALWLAKEARAQQVPGISYDKARSFRSERIFLEPDSSNVERYANRVAFLDGFGREYVAIDVQGSPIAGYDIVQPFHYGKDGRIDRAYLPCALAGNYGKLPENPFDPENWQLIGQDKGYAFSPITYEGRLSGRVTAQMKPGKAWHEAGKRVEYEYGYNAAGEVRLLSVTAGGTLVDGGYYPAGVLEKARVTDEDGRMAETFTDKDGKTVLSRELLGPDWLETYYAYDAKGQLRLVLPPELMNAGDGWDNEGRLGLYAWRFDYDNEGRLVEQKSPGCEPVTYKYDFYYDRVSEIQDGAMREKGGRIVFSYDSRDNRLISKAYLDTVSSGLMRMEEYIYDVAFNTFVATPGYSQGHSDNVAGKVAAIDRYPLGTNLRFRTDFYYDAEGRVIQKVEETTAEGKLRTDYKYDFAGNLVARRESHSYGGKTDVVEQEMRYDDRGRLLELEVSLNGSPCAKVSYAYDFVGRLAGTIAGKASHVYRYNAQGWLTEMEGNTFGYKLRYEAPEGEGAARYNGTISEWEWKQGTGAAMMYALEYDDLERLTGAGQWVKDGDEWENLSGNFTERGITYDRNGNLLGLERTAHGTLVDDLDYFYAGNKLTSVRENVRTSPEGDVYAPRSAASSTFEYDANGNLTKDGRNGLEIQYNCLNLPQRVSRGGDQLALFYYWADGSKARVVDSAGVARHYIGSLTYRESGSGTSELEEVLFSGGVVKIGAEGEPETFYYITDHLGSVRAIADAEGNVVERNDYYPFGAQHARSDYAQLGNRYKFNGKEEEEVGGLKWLDYGARRYDATLGRWMAVDPLGEASMGSSLFAFCSNNPVNRIDPTGMLDDEWALNIETGTVTWMSNTGGAETQIVHPVMCGSEGGLLQAGTSIFIDGEKFYHGQVGNGYGVSATDYWLWSAGGWYAVNYIYDADDLKMRREIMEGNSRVLKAAILNMENAGRMEPLTAGNYWDTYGHTTGSLMLFGDYLSMTLELSAAPRGGAPGMGGLGRMHGMIKLQAGVQQAKSLPAKQPQYTKSNLRRGQEMHTKYRADQVLEDVREKEYLLPSRRRIDFIDFENHIIYELKPNNPRAIKQGYKQLDMYLQEIMSMSKYSKYDWKTVLETY